MTQHARAARDLLAAAEKPGLHSLTRAECLQAALVEATLELAAQRRAATLLAYERIHLGRPDQDGKRPLLEVPPSPWLEEVEQILDIAEVGDRAAS